MRRVLGMVAPSRAVGIECRSTPYDPCCPGLGFQAVGCSLMSMACIQSGTLCGSRLLVRAAMTQRAPAGRVWGQGVQPSVMTTMASGLVSAAATMPVAMSVPPAPWRLIWFVLCMCWSVWTTVSTDRTLTLSPGEPHRVLRRLRPLRGWSHDRAATPGEVPRL